MNNLKDASKEIKIKIDRNTGQPETQNAGLSDYACEILGMALADFIREQAKVERQEIA